MLIDTSGFFCAYNKNEKHHEKSLMYYETAMRRFTTSYVLSEYVALAQIRGVPRSEILKFTARILNDADVVIVWVDETLHRQAVELLQSRPDKTYSLCDAVSFVLMSLHRITDALTTDKHFEQEGFVRLLK